MNAEQKNDVQTDAGRTADEKALSVCFTGHRKIPTENALPLSEALAETVLALYARGFRRFYCGGALGFDMLAEETVIRLLERMPGAELRLALPCRDQTEHWNHTAELRAYQRIKGYAAEIVYLSDFYTPTCMRDRNAYMVDHSSVCVAYYNGALKSGTGQTVRMAQRAGLEIINLWQ